MAGLLSDVLPYLYSQGDRAKRYMKGLLSDPVGSMVQGVNNANDRAGGLLAVTRAAAQEGALGNGPATQQLTNMLIDSYSPVGMTMAKGNNTRAMSTPKSSGYKGQLEGPAYQIDHKPMRVEGGAALLHDLAPVFGEDIYKPTARQIFGSGGGGLWDQAERTTLRKMAEVRGNPNAMVTIYRGVPDGAKGINPGDWVTLDPRVAKEYGNVVEMKVPASHITSWPDSLLEFGYFPK